MCFNSKVYVYIRMHIAETSNNANKAFLLKLVTFKSCILRKKHYCLRALYISYPHANILDYAVYSYVIILANRLISLNLVLTITF